MSTSASGAEAVRVETPAITLSGLWLRPPNGPGRALVVALHGGGYSSGYWDNPLPGASLLQLGAEVGFDVLALDRPGYGLSQGFDPARFRIADQADLVFDAIDAWRATRDCEGPVFLIGHSVGAILALVMGAHPRGAALGGIDVLGAPFRYPETAEGAQIQSLPTTASHAPAIDAAMRRAFLFGPTGTWDEAVLAYDRTCGRPMPVAEYNDGLAAPRAWSRVLPAIPAPVRFGLAEHEVMQATGWEVLAEAKALLTGNPASRVQLQRGAGHNVSMHRAARAYHMAALAFFEEQLATL